MFQQLQSKVPSMCCKTDTVYREKFCRCHRGIVIYRHACQDQDSLSSSMAIAKCVAKTCVAEAGFHHTGCLRKHFQEDIVSVSACIPAPSCCHPTVNGYLSWQRWIWQPLPTVLNSAAFTGAAAGKLSPRFRWNQPLWGHNFWAADWPIGSMAG